MSLNMQRYPANPAGKIKHCYLESKKRSGLGVEYIPHIYFEAKIDFADVRSGLRETCSVSNAAEIYPLDGESLWTKDMVQHIEPSKVRVSAPKKAKLRPLPEFIDADTIALAETQYLNFLSRYFKVRIYRNFDLNSYSGPGETPDDFMARCLEMFSEPFRHDLNSLHEIFERRLGLIKEKHLMSRDWSELDPIRRASQLKSSLHKSSERIEQMFLRANLSLKPSLPKPTHLGSARSELEERLHFLETEAQQAIERLLSIYREKARNIDEYIVHPNLKDIHLVRTCILWMPAEGCER